jgi:hypothetical protein
MNPEDPRHHHQYPIALDNELLRYHEIDALSSSSSPSFLLLQSQSLAQVLQYPKCNIMFGNCIIYD